MSAPVADDWRSQVNDRFGNAASVWDRGLAYGDGLFETLRVNALSPVLADFHWRRLERGLECLGIPLTLARVRQYLSLFMERAAANGASDGVVKIIVTRGAGGRGFAPPTEPSPVVYLTWSDLPDFPLADYDSGIELAWCRQLLAHRPWLAGVKHLNCLEYVLARQYLDETGLRDGLLRDVDGRLIETTNANFFIVRRGELLTPLLDRCGVAGTMREWILSDWASGLDIEAREIELREPDLVGAEEIFICNSVFGVMPVCKVGEYRWQRGPVTRAIQRAITTRLLEHPENDT